VSLALYMDVRVPAAVTRGLLLRNVDVLTAQLDDAAQLEDSELLDRAGQRNRVFCICRLDTGRLSEPIICGLS